MADGVEVEAGDRVVRVTSPDRVIFPEHGDSPALTKLDVVRYYVSVGDGILRALSDRPVALERWPKGVLPGTKLTLREHTHGRGPQGDAFYQKRMMRGAPAWARQTTVLFPSGRRAEELCIDHVAAVAWAAQMGTVTFHPWPTRAADNDRPDELRIDLDPFGSASFTDAVRVAGVARELFASVGIRAFTKTTGKHGVHVYVRIEPRWTFTDVRHAAIAFARRLAQATGGVTTAWWKEERGDNIFVDFNQNCRDRTIASAYSIRPIRGAPVSMPVSWEELADLTEPGAFTVHNAPAHLAAHGDAHAEIDDVAHGIEPLLAWWAEDPREEPYPPEYPKMPGEPKRVQPSKARTD